MAVTVKALFKNGAFLYKMNLLAGKNGLANLVKWVHRIEDNDANSFLHGNELVFTAGILNKEEDWLLNFARRMHETGASALVVKVGQHTSEIPAAACSYCDDVDLPLFTIPWETKMVDMTRDFCHRIMQAEQMDNTIMTTMKNIIFKVGDIETQVLQMERYGFLRNSLYCFLCVQTGAGSDGDAEAHRNALKTAAESAAKNMNGLFTTFTYNECRVLVLANDTDAEIETFLDEFTKRAGRILRGVSLHIGVSTNQAGIYNQNINLEKALSAMEMARKRKETVAVYDKLGIYKVLYAVSDKAVLRSFYNETIGKLEKHDRENGTGLTHLLREYLQNNGSLQAVSEKQFIHRNTVTNQLKKIESIIGCNPLELEDKVKLCMGYLIRDVL